MTTSAPPPRDPELAADPDYRQAAAEDWWGRVADYYADQQAEVEEEARAMAAQDAELDARQMDARASGVLVRRPRPARPARPARGRSSCPLLRPKDRPRRRPSRPAPEPGAMTSAATGTGHVELSQDAEWEAWAEGADVDDILAARSPPSLAARIAEFFKSEPEAGL